MSRAFPSVARSLVFLIRSIRRTDRTIPPTICIMIMIMIVMRTFATAHETCEIVGRPLMALVAFLHVGRFFLGGWLGIRETVEGFETQAILRETICEGFTVEADSYELEEDLLD